MVNDYKGVRDVETRRDVDQGLDQGSAEAHHNTSCHSGIYIPTTASASHPWRHPHIKILHAPLIGFFHSASCVEKDVHRKQLFQIEVPLLIK